MIVCSTVLVALAGCGRSDDGEQAASMQGDPLVDVSAIEAPTRTPSPELPGDDPVFRAAIDLFDGDALEQRTIAVTGLTSNDLGGGYFGQLLFQSFWTPADPDMAMRVCHVLVDYANEIDFPATEIVVKQKTYADLEWSEDLVAVDASGSCAPV